MRYCCGACLHDCRSVEPLEAVRCPSCGGTALPLGQVGTVGLQSIEVARPTGADRLLHAAGLRR